MKKEHFKSIAFLISTLVIFSITIFKSGICTYAATDKFNKSYSFDVSDLPADKLVKVARAQLGKTGESLGYGGTKWCAYFVNDCAKLAGVDNVIFNNTDGYAKTIYTNLTEEGKGRGRELKDGETPQAGDLVFYYNNNNNEYAHVAIMSSSTQSIHGNADPKVIEIPVGYYSVTPNPNAPGAKNYRVIYVRPNYESNHVNENNEDNNSAKIYAYGTLYQYGDNKVEWKIQGTKNNLTLYVDGQGRMGETLNYNSKIHCIKNGEMTECTASRTFFQYDEAVKILGDKNLKHIIIGDGITEISFSAFSVECGRRDEARYQGLYQHVEDVTIGKKVTCIHNGAFYGMRKLKSIKFTGNELKEIGGAVFDYCPLTEIKLPDSVEKIWQYTFYHCDSLKKIKLSKNLKDMPAISFIGLPSLVELRIPSGISEVNEGAKSNTNLRRIYLPKSIKKVTIFDDKSGITDIYYEGSKNQWKKVWKDLKNLKITVHYNVKYELDSSKKVYSDETLICGNNIYKITNGNEVAFSGINGSTKNLTIPTTIYVNKKKYKVTSIAKKALSGNRTITTLSISANIKSIGANAFDGCKKLNKITIDATTSKNIDKNAFRNIKRNAKITIYAKDKKTAQNLLKAINKTGGAKNAKLTYKKSKKVTNSAGGGGSRSNGGGNGGGGVR
jgi:hypothetical protein